jgi:hypothetical protein
MEKSKCFFCLKDATHCDVVVNFDSFIIADVCISHLSMGLVS